MRVQQLKPSLFSSNSIYIVYLLSQCVRKEWRAVYSSITQETNNLFITGPQANVTYYLATTDKEPITPRKLILPNTLQCSSLKSF